MTRISASKLVMRCFRQGMRVKGGDAGIAGDQCQVMQQR